MSGDFKLKPSFVKKTDVKQREDRLVHEKKLI